MVLGLFAVLFSGSPAFAADMDKNAKELAKLDDDWSNAAVKKDLDLVVSFYAEDAMVYAPNEPVAIGRLAAKKVWASYLTDPTSSTSWKTVNAGVSKSGDLGFTAGTYEYMSKGPDGKMVTEKGKYLCLWKKDKEGKWKSVHDIWNADTK